MGHAIQTLSTAGTSPEPRRRPFVGTPPASVGAAQTGGAEEAVKPPPPPKRLWGAPAPPHPPPPTPGGRGGAAGGRRGIRGNVEKVIEGKPEVGPARAGRAARRGPPAHRGRPRRRQDHARQGAGPLRSTARCAASSSRPTCCPRTSPASRSTTRQTREFEFKPGAVFANIVVGDEINRASPKTQSALLECMEERQVTVDGTTYVLEAPFMVIATQNPIEMEGTYPLPEAQRDRFMARVSMGYPSAEAEIEMLDTHGGGGPRRPRTGRRRPPGPQAHRGRPRRPRERRGQALRRRPRHRDPAAPDLRLGASPRATLHLLRAARAPPALDGRDYVLPDDVQGLATSGARAPPAADRRGTGRPPDHRGGRRRPGRATAAARTDEPALTRAGRSVRADDARPVPAGRGAGPCRLRGAARPARPAAGRRLPGLPAAGVGGHRVPHPVPPGLLAPAGSASGRGRAAVHGAAAARQRLPAPQRGPAHGGRASLRPRRPAALRARPGRAQGRARGQLPGARRHPRPLPRRAAVGAPHRPVRAVRADPVVRLQRRPRRHPRRHPPSAGAARRRLGRRRRRPGAVGRGLRQRRRRHPRVPPRRRPAQGPLALHRPGRRAHGPARGAAVPEPRDPAARRPGPRPPRRRTRLLLRVVGQRDRQHLGLAGPFRLRAAAADRDRPRPGTP